MPIVTASSMSLDRTNGKAARGQSLCEGQLGFRHRHADRPPDGDGRRQGRARTARRSPSIRPSSAARTGSRCRSIRRTGLAYANTLAFGGHYKSEPATYKAGEWYVGMDLTDVWEWGDGPARPPQGRLNPMSGKDEVGKWPSDIPRFSGVMSTAGGVVFSGQLTGEF